MGSDGGAVPDAAGPRGLEELPDTLSPGALARPGRYADPPKQQGGPAGTQAPAEAKCNREKTSHVRREPGGVMGESRE